ncbi:MAG: hypothetical protein DMF38_10515 [Verrucomicrobia bacterium]|nr:MAG: hypothetical protein DME78_00045 [Verrucomicrobiota bacterium]PYL33775.1 MAG: hypothetical protein DMF38_10515 [Verrucomicrobiota bacterium]
MPDTSGGTWTVFFKSNSDALNSPKIPVFGQQVIPSGARNPTIAARVAQDNHNVRTSSALPHFV